MQYKMGAHSTLDVGNDQLALISRETRGWAILTKEDYQILLSYFEDHDQRDAPKPDHEFTLQRLHELGLLRREGIHVAGSRPETPVTPDALLLKMTGGCNLTCSYCYDFSDSRRMYHLDPSRAIETIDLIVGKTGKLSITFHGGEPLLRFEQLREIVKHCEMLRSTGASIRYALQTNGTLLSDRTIDFLEAHSFSVGISVDGLSEATDRLRHSGRAGTETPSEMLRRLLRDHGEFLRRRCGILSVVCATTLPQLPQFALWLQDQGMSGLSTTVLDIAGRASGMNDEAITSEQLVGLYGQWLNLIISGQINTLALTNLLAYIDNLSTFNPPSFCQKGPCGAAGDFLVIDADGTYRACDCVIHPFFVIGSQDTHPSAVMGHGPRQAIVDRQQRLLGETICADCPWMQICGGTCAAKAIGYSSDLYHVYDPECAVNKFIYPRILEAFAEDPEGALFQYHSTHSKLAKKAN